MAVAIATGARWPSRREAFHSGVAALMVHGLYLGGVFHAISGGMPAGTKTAPVTLSLVVDGVEYRLVVGDSHGAWRSHQTSATRETFDELFAKLADRPDERIPPSEVRILGP